MKFFAAIVFFFFCLNADAQKSFIEYQGNFPRVADAMNRKADTDPSIDERIDGIFAELGKDQKSYVVDSRMAWFFLPDSFIRKVDNKIEYSWQNDFPHISERGEHFFRYQKGVEYIDVKLFKEVTVAFCLDYIARFRDIYPLVSKCEEELQKAIDIEV